MFDKNKPLIYVLMFSIIILLLISALIIIRHQIQKADKQRPNILEMSSLGTVTNIENIDDDDNYTTKPGHKSYDTNELAQEI